jgi:tetratricopeptide (TPR) repeat protein
MVQAALEHDPDFAMANASLGNAYFSHVYSAPVRGREHYQRALQRSGRLTDRERRYIRATYEGNLGHTEQALELFHTYLRSYPDDAAARYRLGTVLMENGRFAEAIVEFQEAIRADPSSARSHANLATSYSHSGDTAKALAAYRKVLELEPASIGLAAMNHEYGFTLAQSGDVARAREVFATLLARPETQAPGLHALALLDMYQGRYRSANTTLRECVLLAESRGKMFEAVRCRLVLSILLEGAGDRQGSMEQLNRVQRDLFVAAPQNLLASRVAVSYARLGAIQKAGRIVQQVRRQVDAANPQETSELHRAEGELAVARGDTERGLEFLAAAEQESVNPLTVESLARAHGRRGDTARSIAYYEQLVGMGRRALGWEPQQLWLAAHIDVAKAYREQGQREKAYAILERLSGLWKAADPGLPLAKAIAQLQKELLK